jgi:hypothetical protein
VIFATDEQRQILEQDGVPMPLIDGNAGKCYMVMPIEFSDIGTSIVRARMPGIAAVAEAEVPSDAAMTLAVLMRRMLE